MLQMYRRARRMAALLALSLVPALASAQTIRIGVVGEFSGLFADLGKKVTEGMQLYMKQHGDTVAGKKIELVIRDVGGPNADVAKRLTQELIVRDKVDILMGYIATPNAIASVPIASQAKKPMFLVQAATSGITEKSPYAVRLSYTLGQVSAPLGPWAAKNGIKTVFTVVADYGPGYDAEKAFTEAFTAAGGKVIGGVKAPLGNLDFAAFVQRARDAKPDAVFAFVPAGETAAAFMKTYAERGLAKAGIRLITTGDLVSDGNIDAIGDAALGVISTHHYSAAHDSAENRALVKAYEEAYGTKVRPDFFVVQAYDTMAVIYDVARKLNGNIDPDKFMAALKGYKLMSARGPITIDAETRNVQQTIYIRRVERKGDRLYNIEFDKAE